MNPVETQRTVSQYMDQLVNELRGLVPKALREFDVEAIHQSRVATRRLTAAVRLLQPVLSKSHRRPFERVLRRLRRRLGPLRDLDVILEFLSDLPECAKYPLAVAWVRQKLTKRRDGLREELADAPVVGRTLSRLGSWWAVHDEVEEAAEAIGCLLTESVHLQVDAFVEQADRLADGNVPSADGEVQDPHELRITGKALRYTLELAVTSGHPLPPAVLKSFKQMQESLGQWHDMVVLSETVQRTSLDHELALHESTAATQVLDLAKVTLAKASKAMSKFLSQWRSSGDDLARTIRQAFPLTKPLPSPLDGVEPDCKDAPTAEADPPADAPVTESETDPDPSATDEPAAPDVLPKDVPPPT